jgi:pimeloyl-ACP methyl ester carboxylesterase
LNALNAASNPGSQAILDLLEGGGGAPDGPPGVVARASNAAGDATVALRREAQDGWSMQIQEARRGLPGLGGRSSTRVHGDAATLAAIIRGRRSGVEAFLRGDIRVRGNIALAMQLEGLFATRARSRRFPHPRTCRAAGVETFYMEGGASGPPVILLHGLGATNASMLSTLWDLSADHHVFAPDLPGHGASGKPIRTYHVGFFARWLSAFMDDLGLDRAILIGNSMGGRIAIEAGLRMPERVRRLVLLCPSSAWLRGRELAPLVRLLRPELGVFPLLLPHSQVVAAARGMFAVPSRLPDAWYDAFADEFLRVFADPRGRVAFFSSAREIYLEEPHGERGFWDRLPGLKPPSLFVWGGRDPLVPPGFARHVQRELPQAQSVVLPDCGHVPQYELPEVTSELVRDFLRRR